MFAAFAAAMNSSDIAARAMLMPPEAEPGEHRHGDGFIDERIGDRPERSGNRRKARQQRNHPTKSILGRGIERRKQSPGNRCLATIREFCNHGTPGKDEHRYYTKEQRTLDCPYGCHRTNLGNDRMAAECDFVLRAVSPKHQMRKYEVRDAHHN